MSAALSYLSCPAGNVSCLVHLRSTGNPTGRVCSMATGESSRTWSAKSAGQSRATGLQVCGAVQSHRAVQGHRAVKKQRAGQEHRAGQRNWVGQRPVGVKLRPSWGQKTIQNRSQERLQGSQNRPRIDKKNTKNLKITRFFDLESSPFVKSDRILEIRSFILEI